MQPKPTLVLLAISALLIVGLALSLWSYLAPASTTAPDVAPDAISTSPSARPANASAVQHPSTASSNDRRDRRTAYTPPPDTALPPAGTPLHESFDTLRALAQAGNKQAAARLYRELRRCKSVVAWQSYSLTQASALLAQDANDTSDRQLQQAQRGMNYINRFHAQCADLDSSVFRQLTPIMLKAAQLGVSAARDCYVHRGPLLDPTSLLRHPAYLATYRRVAPGLIQAAIADGDWRMVEMLQYAYRSTSSKSLIAGLIGPDSLQRYRYLKLFSLGATGRRVARIQGKLAGVAESLSMDQRARANAWAERTYSSHFHGSSTDAAPHGWNACAMPHG